MTSWRVRIAIAFAVLLSAAGWMASAVLLQHHLTLEVGGDPLLGGVCVDSPKISCDEVIGSRWGKFAGQPTALWGYAFFSFCLAWFLVVGRATGRQRWMHTLLCLVLIAAAIGCVYLAFVMYGTLGKVCPLCTTTHAVTWLLLLLALLLRSRPQPGYGVGPLVPQLMANPAERTPLQWPAPSHPSWGLAAVALLLGGAITVVGWSEYGRRRAQAYADEYRRRVDLYESSLADLYARFMEQEQHDFVIGPDDPVRGNDNALHTVVVFSDFQCPWCRGAADILDEKLTQFPHHFRIVFRHFPMDQVCNPSISRTLHAGACAAAVVAEAARIVAGNDAFWKMHDALFADQAGFRRGAEQWTRQIAAKLGMDVEQLWKKSTGSTSTWNRVRANVAEGQSLGLNGTPAVYLDGRKLDRYADEQFWHYIVWLDDQQKLPQGFRMAHRFRTRPAGHPSTRPADYQHQADPATESSTSQAD